MIIYYRDFNKKGGVPEEIREYYKSLRQSGENLIVITSFLQIVLHIVQKKQDEILFIGFFFKRYLLVWLLIRLFNLNFSVWPLGQISEFSLMYNLFDKTPIIEDIQKTNESNLKKSVAKKIFVFLSKLIISQKNLTLYYFSNFEKIYLQKKFKSAKYRRQYWLISENTKTHNTVYKNTNNIIFLCWSRIDIEVKGIDRFYRFIDSISGYNQNKYKGIACGPYYSGRIESLIKTEFFEIINTLENKSNYHFKDGHFIVLLSRWDGFPRVLREALVAKIPIIVSEETHFSEIINKYKVGILIDDYDSKQNIHKLNNFNLDECEFENAIAEINNFNSKWKQS